MWPFTRRTQPSDSTLVFAARDRTSLLLARSLLDDAGIPYVVNGDFAQDIVSWGRVGTGWNVAVGPPTVWVRTEDADRAQEALASLRDYKPSRIPLWLRLLAAAALVVPVVTLLLIWLNAR